MDELAWDMTSSRPGLQKSQTSSGAVIAFAVMVTAGSLAATIGKLVSLKSVTHLPAVNLWSLAILFALAEALPVHLEHRREAVSITLSTVPLVIGLYGLSPVTLIVARLAGSALTLLVHRRQRPTKLTVNLASFWMQTAVSVFVFRALTAQAEGWKAWPGVAVAVLAGDAAQTVVLTFAISLYQRHWEQSLLRSAVLSSAAAGVETSLGIVAVTLLRSQPAALAPLGVVALLVLLSYRTYRSLGDRHRELGRLYDFSRAMGDALLEGRVVPALLSQARVVMHAEQACLYLQSADRLVRFSDTGSGTTVEPDDGLGTALRQITGPSHEPRLVGAGDERLHHTASWAEGHEMMVAPLIGAAGVIGTLVVIDRSGQVRHFGPDDLGLFATLARQASVSLENDRLVDQLKEKAAESEHQSLHDSLTGLPNRVLFSRHLEKVLEGGSAAAVLLLDLDRFKEVNDTLGHHNGDMLLQQVGTRLRSTLRRGDVIARLGGDEFAVLLPDIDGDHAALQVGRGIVDLLEQPFVIGDMSIDIGASIGIAFAPRDGLDSVTLVQRADVAMYTAKADQTGVETYRPDRDGYSPERLRLVGELRHAVHDQQLAVHYQPQIDLRTGDVVGVEALLRWNHPTRGTIRPDEFIPIAEHTGLIWPLTLFVLEDALRSSRQWRRAGRALRVSVNLSARSLLEPTLTSEVDAALRRYDIPPGGLCLEITETCIMGDPRRTAAALDALRNLGVTIAVDDFGTGQSSLGYIKRLPVGEIKIDKSFVLSMRNDHSDAAIVETVVNLARNLDIPVLAEGVEDHVTRDRLQALGCSLAQGYLFGSPMPEPELRTWLAERAMDSPSSHVISLLNPVMGPIPSTAKTAS